MTTTPEQPGRWPPDDFVTTEELVRRQGEQPITTVDDVAAAEDPLLLTDSPLSSCYRHARARVARPAAWSLRHALRTRPPWMSSTNAAPATSTPAERAMNARKPRSRCEDW